MKQGIIFILILLILLQPLGKIEIFIIFKIHQADIAKTLCLQKEIANNSCQGKCQLKKQLERAEKEEQKRLPAKNKKTVEKYWISITFDKLLPSQFCADNLFLDHQKSASFSTFLCDIFRPPQYLAV